MRSLLFSHKKSAEKVRKSQHYNFATTVRKSIKVSKCTIPKQNVKRSDTRNMLIRDFGLFLQYFSTPLFVTHCRIVSFQGLRVRLTVSAFTDKLSAESGLPGLSLLECMLIILNGTCFMLLECFVLSLKGRPSNTLIMWKSYEMRLSPSLPQHGKCP